MGELGLCSDYFEGCKGKAAFDLWGGGEAVCH